MNVFTMSKTSFNAYRIAKGYIPLYEVVAWLTSPSTASKSDVSDMFRVLHDEVKPSIGRTIQVQNTLSGSVYACYASDGKLHITGTPHSSGGKKFGIGEWRGGEFTVIPDTDEMGTPLVNNSRLSNRGYHVELNIAGAYPLRMLFGRREAGKHSLLGTLRAIQGQATEASYL